MPDPKECPLCGTSMRIKLSESSVRIPGNPQPTTRQIAEWICPECDYYEEVEEG